ncbi:hypothetical protein [Alicyclobacillus shizuokensis]|uniref:hypothetical protein n=1 Tax=Alicyclobacillus shizuokensis TaxID=392014 RepID=UPI00082CD2D3|nr:hypothetical protein [Alicyclobacillus shizuokensis]
MFRDRYSVDVVSEAYQSVDFDQNTKLISYWDSPNIGSPLRVLVTDSKTGEIYVIEAEQYWGDEHIYNAVQELVNSIEEKEPKVVQKS